MAASSTALVRVDEGRCPQCHQETATMSVHQPALLRHGGYGATRRTVMEYCPRCPWHLIRQRSEVRP